MSESTETFSLEQAQADIESLLRESYDLLSEKESLLDNVDKLQHWIMRSEGDVEKLMPSSQYSDKDRTLFLDELEGFIDEGLRWEAEHVHDEPAPSTKGSKKHHNFRVL